MNEVELYDILYDPIDIQVYKQAVVHPTCGAVILFTGHVREWTKGIQTQYLVYEAYIPMAKKMLEKIGMEVKSKWPETRVAIAHRVGKVAISEIAVVIAVAAPHRKAAYAASEYTIGRVKEVVPIWKKISAREKRYGFIVIQIVRRKA